MCIVKYKRSFQLNEFIKIQKNLLKLKFNSFFLLFEFIKIQREEKNCHSSII